MSPVMDRLRNGTQALTDEDQESLPGLGATNGQSLEEHMLWVKYFDPVGSWTWYAAEFDPDSRIFFGFVEGFEGEWGYFSLDEILSVEGPLSLGIERDLYFTPCRFSELATCG